MGERLLFDTEGDGLLATTTKLHSIQIGTLGGRDAVVYCDALRGYPSLAEGLERLHNAEVLYGHNSIGHDWPVLDKLHPGTVRWEQIRDTLVMARLWDPEERHHSLDDWGKRLGVLKGTFKGPWDVCTPEMLTYAAQDIAVTRALYHKVKEVEEWGESCTLEHEVARAIAAQERNGFGFDVEAAQRLDAELRGQLEEEKARLRRTFKPRWVAAQNVPFVPKVTLKKQGYTAGVPLTKVALEIFNPASRPQIASRLRDKGWKPKAFTKGGAPQIDEAVLAALPYEEAQQLVHFFTLNKKIGQLSDGDNAWLKLVKDDPHGGTGRVYGRVNSNGACTGRMSHFKPNMAQVDTDPRMRALWVPRPGWQLVGCDAEGLEARMLAHYLGRYDDGLMTQRLIAGDKSKGTDVHSANMQAIRALGFQDCTREAAKTILYALMYGAGDWKIGMTLQGWLQAQGKPRVMLPAKEIGLLIRRALETSMVGMGQLVKAVQANAKAQGYLRGVDGRHIPVRSPHSALNTLLQGGGAIVMKRALGTFWDRHRDLEGWAMCANVHDEVQMECDPHVAQAMGSEFADCIYMAGRHYGLRCPLAGAYSIGSNWAETH